MIIRAWLIAGSVLIVIAWVLTVPYSPHPFQGSVTSTIEDYRARGLVPEPGQLVMSRAVGHDVFEVPETDALHAQKEAAAMDSMPGMNMPGMNMSEPPEHAAGDDGKEPAHDEQPMAPMPMHGNSEQPMAPMPMHGNSEQPTAPMPMHGNSEQPTAPMPMHGSSEQPMAPMQMHGNSEQPMAPMQMHGSSEQPMAPMPMHGNSEQPMAPMQMQGSGEQPMAPMQMQGSGEQPMAPMQMQGSGEQPMAPMPMHGNSEQPMAPMQMHGSSEQPMAPMQMEGSGGHGEGAQSASGTESMAGHGTQAETPGMAMPGMDMTQSGQAGGHGGGAGITQLDSGTPTAAAARTVRIEMSEWGFSPANLDVKHGESVRLLVHNIGNMPHEFMLMTHAGMGAVNYRLQRADWNLLEHEAIYERELVLPGDEIEVVLRIDQPGAWMFMCMFPYHMQFGMMGVMATEGMAMDMGGMKM